MNRLQARIMLIELLTTKYKLKARFKMEGQSNQLLLNRISPDLFQIRLKWKGTPTNCNLHNLHHI